MGHLPVQKRSTVPKGFGLAGPYHFIEGRFLPERILLGRAIETVQNKKQLLLLHC